MALIKCPECEKRVSSFAQQCPECGYVLNNAIVTCESNERPNHETLQKVEEKIVDHTPAPLTDQEPFENFGCGVPLLAGFILTILIFGLMTSWSFQHMDDSNIVILGVLLSGLIALLIWAIGSGLKRADYNQALRDAEPEKRANYNKWLSKNGYTLSVHLDIDGKQVITDYARRVLLIDYLEVPFSKILGTDYLSETTSQAKGTTSRAVVGGLIAGGVGAAIGASTAQREYDTKITGIVVYISDYEHKSVTFYADHNDCKHLALLIEKLRHG